MILSIIVAMAENRVIGKNNQLPWHISDDLKRFKAITMGHPIIMGRKTYESIGKPLPGRHNIVLSRTRPLKIDGVTVVHSLKEALDIFYNEGRGKEELFVIGGHSLFQEALPQANKIYLTQIHKEFEGDVYFPSTDLKKEFDEVEKTDHHTQENGGLAYSFITLSRKSANP